MKTELLNAFEAAIAPGNTAHQCVVPYQTPADPSLHQFVLFVKPEATAVQDGVRLDGVLDIVLDRLTAFDVKIGGARVLPGAYLSEYSIMDRHYGVINAISKGGREALTDAANAKLEEVFAEDLAAGARVLGGHQFLAEQKDISPLALSTMNDNIGTTKLGGGSYVMKVNVLGHQYLLLNPFHAYQLVPFTTPGNAIIVLEGLSTTPWADLRGKLTGATNPAKAVEGSIRAGFLAHKDDLGLRDVNQGANGVHLSAGPLEGMVELQRFFSSPDHTLEWNETAMGQLLQSAGLDAAALATNPTLDDQRDRISAFDLTEEVDAADAISRLQAGSLV